MKKFINTMQGIFFPLFTITIAIFITIIFRPFFYLHIKPLNLAADNNLKIFEVKASYNKTMDYLMFFKKNFDPSPLKFTKEGADHFKDVRTLFLVNFIILLLSSIILIATMIIKIKKTSYRTSKNSFSPLFISSVSLLSTFLFIGGLAAINFDKTFTIFHKIFFPGKDNWQFDENKDEIIKILPFDFFRNCAILIVSIILTITLTVIIYEVIKVVKARKKEKLEYEQNL